MKRMLRCLFIDVASSYRENLAYNMVMRRLAWIAVLASPVLGATQEYVAEIVPVPFAEYARAVDIENGMIAGRMRHSGFSFLMHGGHFSLMPRGFQVTSLGGGAIGGDIWAGADGGYWVDGRFVSLKPIGAASISVLSVRGEAIQGGFIQWDELGDPLPYIWYGSRDSARALLPLGWFNGSICDATEKIQVGYAFRPGGGGACVWFGTAESARIIHPHGLRSSGALATAGDQVVGRGYVGGITYQALLWRLPDLTPESLHPSNATWSWAYDTNGINQCGSAVIDRVQRAVVWSGSRDQYIDLHRLLPRGYRTSEALAIDADGTAVGYAVDARGFDRLVRWRRQ